jgi:deuterolysin
VAAIYDFASAGVGSFNFEPITTFASPESDSKALKFTSAAPSTNSVAVEVTSDVKRKTVRITNEKRAVISCSNASQKAFITSS